MFINFNNISNLIKKMLLLCLFLLVTSGISAQQPVVWQHISSITGGIEVPNMGNQQTSAAIADFDNDGLVDFCISERTRAPALVWYKREEKGWKKFTVEADSLHIEAGTTTCDVDGDGDAPRIDIWLQNGTGTRITNPIKQ
jgi:hypothetical protein